RHEDGAADQKESKDKQHIKDSQARQLGERIECDGEDPGDRERAMRPCQRRSVERLKHQIVSVIRHFCFSVLSSFDIRDSSFLAVASRNNLSSVVVDFRRSISFAFDRLMTDSISLTS